MKLNLTIQLDKNELPIDWRRVMLAFIKSRLQKEAPDLYHEYYNKNSTMKKPFTFWTLLNKPKFNKNSIELENDQFQLFISTTNTQLAFYLYNAFKLFKSKFPLQNDNNMVATYVKLVDEVPIKSNEIVIQMLSPLVVREHIKGQKDKYVLFNEDGFTEILIKMYKLK